MQYLLVAASSSSDKQVLHLKLIDISLVAAIIVACIQSGALWHTGMHQTRAHSLEARHCCSKPNLHSANAATLSGAPSCMSEGSVLRTDATSCIRLAAQCI